MKINIKLLSENARLPKNAHPDDAGYDLYSIQDYKIRPFERILIRTGISMEIPQGYYGRIADRSGLAYKSGMHIIAGTIDANFRGELGIVMINLNGINLISSLGNSSPSERAMSSLFGCSETFSIKAGDRVAQLIIQKCESVEWNKVEQLESSIRKDGGFGSSGN